MQKSLSDLKLELGAGDYEALLALPRSSMVFALYVDQDALPVNTTRLTNAETVLRGWAKRCPLLSEILDADQLSLTSDPALSITRACDAGDPARHEALGAALRRALGDDYYAEFCVALWMSLVGAQQVTFGDSVPEDLKSSVIYLTVELGIDVDRGRRLLGV